MLDSSGFQCFGAWGHIWKSKNHEIPISQKKKQRCLDTSTHNRQNTHNLQNETKNHRQLSFFKKNPSKTKASEKNNNRKNLWENHLQPKIRKTSPNSQRNKVDRTPTWDPEAIWEKGDMRVGGLDASLSSTALPKGLKHTHT